ncbi:proteasome regulatory particle base subunit [Allomyces javanicus]|nr:proteasome regulatory particle base subunit [Allomyces javanicus]
MPTRRNSSSALRFLAAIAAVVILAATVAHALSADVKIQPAKGEPATLAVAANQPWKSAPALDAQSAVTVTLHDASAFTHFQVLATPTSARGAAALIPATLARGGKNVLQLSLDAFDAKSGEYDFGVAASNRQTHETAYLPLGRAAWTSTPASIPAAIQSFWTPQPPIEHVFRADEPSPNMFLAGTFAVAVIAPWVVLVPMWLLTAKHMPVRWTASGTAFLACIAAFMALASLYWTHLNLVQTLPLAAALAAVTVPTGVAALRGLAARSEEGKSK